MPKLTRRKTWKILTSNRLKLLINARVSIVKAKEVLKAVDEETENIYKDLKYAQISYVNDYEIVFESGIAIEYEDIINAYLIDDLLYLDLCTRLMVYLIE